MLLFYMNYFLTYYKRKLLKTFAGVGKVFPSTLLFT